MGAVLDRPGFESDDTERGGVQSVEVAGAILKAIADLQHPSTLAEIARHAGIHPSKVHRYLVSLTRADLVEQDAARGKYGPGPLTVTLGLARLRDLDFVSIASSRLKLLRDAVDETALLVMWSDQGPIVLKLEESARPVFLNVRVGSTLPLFRTAAGHVFSAFLQPSRIKSLLDREMKEFGSADARKTFLAELADVKKSRLGRVEGRLVPGVSALAAPIFNLEGQIVAAIGLLGRDVDLDLSVTGRAAQALLEAARAISEKLGCLAYDEQPQSNKR